MTKLKVALTAMILTLGISSQARVLNCTLNPAIGQPIDRPVNQLGQCLGRQEDDEVQLRLDFGKREFSLDYYRGICHGWPSQSHAIGALIGPEGLGAIVDYRLKGKVGYFGGEPTSEFEASMQQEVSQPRKFIIELSGDRYALICEPEKED